LEPGLRGDIIMKKSVAIITARGGSKRIPRKNIRDFLGEPIISYSIAAAATASCFDEIMLSTDDAEIAEIAEKYGAQIPFFRSRETSDDFATTAEVLVEVLQEYKNRGIEYKYACCIYPTAPFVTGRRIKLSYGKLIENDADSVFPVVRYSYPIQRALKIQDGKLQMFWPEHLNSRSQDLPPAYHDAGQFYWIHVERFLENKRLFTENSLPVMMPEIEVQDIDTEEDWEVAELKYRILSKNR